MEQPVTVEEQNGIVVLKINRPASYNAFDLNTVQLLAESLIDLALSPVVAAVVISGEGKAFCAGGDLRWASGCGKPLSQAFHELAAHFHQAILEIRRMPKPVVAAVHGMAAGGGFSLALACDFRIMETSAMLRQAYTSSGLSIDGGGTYALPRLIGAAKALEIAALDRPITAEQAAEWGLATEVVPDGEALNRAVQFAQELKAKSLSSFAASKQLISDSHQGPLEAQLEKERQWLSWCANQPNGQEGISAFVKKRKPVFNQ